MEMKTGIVVAGGGLVWGTASSMVMIHGLKLQDRHNAIPGAEYWAPFQRGDEAFNILAHPDRWGAAEIGIATFVPLALILLWLNRPFQRSY